MLAFNHVNNGKKTKVHINYTICIFPSIYIIVYRHTLLSPSRL